MTATTATKPKITKVRTKASAVSDAPTQAKPQKASAPLKAAPKPRPQRPSIPLHDIQTGYHGASGVTNTRATKTEINFSTFGTRVDLAMTDRDITSLEGLRKTFEQRVFPRANIDAGIIRRLGERGFIEHVSGSGVAPDATFKLSARAFKTA